jgi:hypothetical protein
MLLQNELCRVILCVGTTYARENEYDLPTNALNTDCLERSFFTFRSNYLAANQCLRRIFA